MKLHLTNSNATYQINAYDQHSVTINEQVYAHSLIIMPEYLTKWDIDNFDALMPAHFEPMCKLSPDLILLGTGKTLRFPKPELLASLLKQGIGIEVMDTPAACRTYTILVAEGRVVAAALMFG